jgi:hypothetical protein
MGIKLMQTIITKIHAESLPFKWMATRKRDSWQDISVHTEDFKAGSALPQIILQVLVTVQHSSFTKMELWHSTSLIPSLI